MKQLNMKKTILALMMFLSLSAKSQTQTTLLNRVESIDTTKKEPPTKWYTNNKNTALFQYNNGNSKLLYTIKADGSIELGDLIIDAVIKSLQERGYALIKVGGSVTNNKRNK